VGQPQRSWHRLALARLGRDVLVDDLREPVDDLTAEPHPRSVLKAL
jgi:hypothetical protein